MSTSNWLPAAAVIPLAPADPARADWYGHWVAGEAHITIAPGAKGRLAITGSATYGAFDPERVRRGAVNSGEFAASVQPLGARISFTQADDQTLPYDQGDAFACRVRLALLGPYLVATDNDQCGGHNVSFSGIYRRKG